MPGKTVSELEKALVRCKGTASGLRAFETDAKAAVREADPSVGPHVTRGDVLDRIRGTVGSSNQVLEEIRDIVGGKYKAVSTDGTPRAPNDEDIKRLVGQLVAQGSKELGQSASPPEPQSENFFQKLWKKITSAA
ncbi:MAG: hypothetical protein M3Q36_01145 [bacterium]|nr:hypothetical protein [bacterium]